MVVNTETGTVATCSIGSQCEIFEGKLKKRKIRRLGNTDEDINPSKWRKKILLFCLIFTLIIALILGHYFTCHSPCRREILAEFLNNYRNQYNSIVYGKQNYCDRHQPLNSERIFNAIEKQRILHQEKALKSLRTTLDNTDSLNSIAIVGSVGVGKTLVITLLAEHFPWPENVHTYSWTTAVNDESEKFHVLRIMLEHFSDCGRNLLIIENLQTCDYGVVHLMNELIAEMSGHLKSVIVAYVFSINTQLDGDVLEEEREFLDKSLPGTNIIHFRTFTKNELRDCIVREARLENVTLSPQDFDEIVDTINPYRCGCKNVNAKVRLYGTIKTNF